MWKAFLCKIYCPKMPLVVDKFGVWKSILTCFKPRVLKSQMDFVDLDPWVIFKFSLFHDYAYSMLCLNQVEILRQNEKPFKISLQ